MRKHLIPIIIFALSVLIVALGIGQLVLYIPPQLDMLGQATLQGAPHEQVSDYYWQQFLPQVFTYVINALGIGGILFAIGMLYVKRDTKKTTNNSFISRQSNSSHADDNELDDFFEEFEALEDERRNE